MIHTLHGQVSPTDNATPHFLWSELACKCGCGSAYIKPNSIDMLEHLRVMLGVSLTINSAARCPVHNASVGGAPASFHRSTVNTPSCAYDVSLKNVVKPELIRVAEAIGFQGLGVNYNSFVHVDSRQYKAKW